MSKDVVHNKNCRVCKSANLKKIFDLGQQPPANRFLKKEDLGKPEKKFPLVVYFCKNCCLLQILDVVNPELLFFNYPYETSASPVLAEHFVKLGKELVGRYITSKEDLVIDIGGNDAVLLASIKEKCRALNIEPAKNIAKISQDKGITTIEKFFNKKLAEKIVKTHGKAKIITASNVFAHINDLESVLEGIKILLEDKGIFVVEVHWVANLLGLSGVGGFDQIYHEHLCYFSLKSLKKLVSRFGFEVFDVNLIPIHGRSLQAFIGKKKYYKTGKKVRDFIKKEKSLALYNIGTYLDFKRAVEKNKKELKDLLLKLKKESKRIVGYGAPAKGNTLLNYCGVGNDILDFLVDNSILKQGTYTPGVHIPVYSPSKLKEEKIDYVLLLAWNYADSILKKEKNLREEGVKFIIPVPEPKIV